MRIWQLMTMVHCYYNDLFKESTDNCFDCHLKANPCMNWAGCSDVDGRCECPIGFGGNDCGQVRCGSPARGLDRPLRTGPSCKCDDGWGGINCNICQTDQACDSIVPSKRNGTCYNSVGPVHKNELLCDIKSSFP